MPDAICDFPGCTELAGITSLCPMHNALLTGDPQTEAEAAEQERARAEYDSKPIRCPQCGCELAEMGVIATMTEIVEYRYGGADFGLIERRDKGNSEFAEQLYECGGCGADLIDLVLEGPLADYL